MLIAEQVDVDVFGSNLGRNNTVLGYFRLSSAIIRFLSVPPG
jgi:hypothetical protein